jgi:hypothetical protein
MRQCILSNETLMRQVWNFIYHLQSGEIKVEGVILVGLANSNSYNNISTFHSEAVSYRIPNLEQTSSIIIYDLLLLPLCHVFASSHFVSYLFSSYFLFSCCTFVSLFLFLFLFFLFPSLSPLIVLSFLAFLLSFSSFYFDEFFPSSNFHSFNFDSSSMSVMKTASLINAFLRRFFCSIGQCKYKISLIKLMF